MQQKHKKGREQTSISQTPSSAGARSQGTEPSPLLLVPLANLMRSVSWAAPGDDGPSHSSAQRPLYPIHPTPTLLVPAAHTERGKYPTRALGMASPGTWCTQDLHPSPHTSRGQERLWPAAREGGGRRFNSCSANNLYITLKNFPCAFPARLPFTIPLINSGEN